MLFRSTLFLSAQNQVTWNGSPITEGDLVSLLNATKAMNPQPVLQFQPEEYASYEKANRLMRIITLTKVSSFGFVGNEAYRTFGKAGQ